MSPMETSMLAWEWSDPILTGVLLLILLGILGVAWVLLTLADVFLQFLNRRGPR